MDDGDNPLLGAWHLQRWEIAYGDGRPATLPYGADAQGLIVYTHDGWMSACIMRPGRPPMSSESMRSAPAAERLAAFESYFQYAGRYVISQGPGGPQVEHRVLHALNPNFVGSTQVRNMAFDGKGGLVLSASDTVPGSSVARHHRLAWSRTPP